ncbi:SDR family NAD(P)-dependent oxidoreductase [Arhodomonas sp. AD133]|uniref:SDR family NAD(P)-dependent oxidoreductase n=1 Tax=Arhodomonas sp. AD133 TaxID=3415009 RepID=UPI003EB8B48E
MADGTFELKFKLVPENPLLSGHVVYGRRLMPGVGYVDLVLQALRRQQVPLPQVELRNLSVLAPLVVAEGERAQMTVAGRPVPAGGLRIEVRSRREHDSTEVLHAVANASPTEPAIFHQTLSLPIPGAESQTHFDEIYDWCREHELVHSGFMKIDGVVHHRPDDWVAELQLAPEHRATADAFAFHPALFEGGLLGGGIALSMLHADSDGPGLYLPLTFESFQASGSLGSRCFVRVPARSISRDDELIRLAVEFYDEQGRQVAEIGQFVAKRVPEAGALDVREDGPGTKPARQARPAGTQAAAAPTGHSEAMTSLLRRLVAERLDCSADQVGIHAGYYDLGLASADLLSLVSDLENALSLSLSPTLLFEHKTISALAAWLETQTDAPTSGASRDGTDPARSPVERSQVSEAAHSGLREALIDEIAALLSIPAEAVEPTSDFAEFGLDWTACAQLTSRLNERYELSLDSTVFSQCRCVDALAAFLADPKPAAGGPADAYARSLGAAPPGVAAPEDTGSRPLLQSLSETGDEAVFEAALDGREPFLRDHRVRGDLVLPGVVHLELAHQAVRHALGDPEPNRVHLDDIVWLRPAVCGTDGLKLRITVRHQAGGAAGFNIEHVHDDGALTLCSRGRARLGDADERHVDLDALRAATGAAAHDHAWFYDFYTRAGLDYGPAQRSVREIRTGQDAQNRSQVLAELHTPGEAGFAGRLRLHPSIADGALQATLGLWLSGEGTSGDSMRVALPFSLQRLHTLRPTPERAYAWVRHQANSDAKAGSARLDVTIVDEHGNVCAELDGLGTRVLASDGESEGKAPSPRRPASSHASAPGDSPQSNSSPGVRAVASNADTDIAIVGVNGRYPEAADLDAFWENLRSGRDCIREIPRERWDRRRLLEGNDQPATRWGGFLDGIDRFDPLFFQISMLEADYLDPQERLFLECAHHALEDAGYTGQSLARALEGRTGGARGRDVGVFVGVMYQEYQLYGAQAQALGQPVALSGSASTVANRVSYFYDFHGPSMAVDTMCSSSLTSIHLACESIRSGQCGAALAGGVNLSPHPNKYLMLGQRHFLSSDGRCRSFGEGGDGYVPGEGVGAVLLKPLQAAVADGDHIYGVIKGTALNHGGRTTGYSVPSPVAQGEVIANALSVAGVDPRSLTYLEAHGTGTSLGDPIEIDGVMKAFQQAGGVPEHCAIGSVKSNIGHGESAAGIAGVTKVLLQMQHGELVPSLHSSRLNPHIKFDRTPLRVQQRVEPWRRPEREVAGEPRALPRIAGVSGFGAGGSNAHVILAEYIPEPETSRAPAGPSVPALFVLSAMSGEQVVQQAQRLSARLAQLDDGELHSVAWTLQTGRLALDERLAFAASSIRDARAVLDAYAAAPDQPGPWLRGTVRPGQEPAPEALAAAVSAWRAHAEHEELLTLWTKGAEVDWDAVRPASVRPRRISLPGYPFARDRCWVDIDVPGEASATALPPAATTTAEAPAPEGELVLLSPVWRAQRDTASREDRVPGGNAPDAERHVLVVARPGNALAASLVATLGPDVHTEVIDLAGDSLATQYEQLATRLCERIRGLLERGVRRRTILQVTVVGAAGGDERQRLGCLGGVAGLLKTAHQENPLLLTQYVECLDEPSAGLVASRLAQEARLESPVEVRYRDGQRWTMTFEPVPDSAPAAPFRRDGVYLVTGGAGALGLVVARDIAASAGEATVVLVGRSELREDQQRALDTLRSTGLTVEYRRADVAERNAVADLLADVTRAHGPLTGIVHSAGVIRDGLLAGKPTDDVRHVLGPKVAGLVHLDELSREQPLECFLCFSSIGGTFGNAGQGDYAAANAFMDAYAGYRNGLVDAGRCSGRTVSIAWPLWDEGGMGLDGPVRERLERAGLAPLDTPRGLQAMRLALGAANDGLDTGRVVVLVGERSRLLAELVKEDRAEALGHGAANPAPERATPAQSETAGEPQQSGHSRGFEDRAIAQLRRVLAAALKLAPGRIDPDASLERYGMDSVIAVDVVSKLESAFGPLSSTLLLEVQTIRALARHLLEEHPAQAQTWIGVDRESEAAPAETAGANEAESNAPDQDTAHSVTAPTPSSGPRVEEPRSDDIAIIGVTGRYPMAEDLEAFWANLRDGRDCVTELPAERWADEGFDPSGLPPAWGSFLDGIDQFDPLFFGISPREAAAMDPQQRLYLETVWLLFEHSGITQQVLEQRYRRNVGVYVGSQYQMYRTDGGDAGLAALTSAASYNLIANRVSHFFGLEGPSLAVDSMCTSSTMAIHLACADLLRGETELAVAGGVNLTVHPEKYQALSEMQLLGSTPGSRSFHGGDGYIPAEAVGAVLLKPLEAALRDGDDIRAVIKSTASMHGGRANGFMTPSHRTRVNVMRRALERAGVEPESIGYVEASAEGSAMADNVEVRALREVFQGTTEPVALGTVKSNLGHPEAASGIAQITKVVLQLEHGELPPFVEVGQPDEALDLADTPLHFCDRLSPWQPRSQADANGRPAPLRALVNSVAAGGSHVSLVVEAPPPAEPVDEPTASPADDFQLVLLSARTPRQLRVAAQRLHDYLQAERPASLADIAYTTQLGREALDERLAVVARSREELADTLAHYFASDQPESDAESLLRGGGSLYTGNADRDPGALAVALSGARGEQLLAGLVADRDLERLAELWVAGADIPWRGLHDGRRKLVPLPATVFDRRRCWIGRSARTPAYEQSAGIDDGAGALDTRPAPAQDHPEATDAERTMVDAWSQLLELAPDELEPTSDFFALGGGSLMASRLVNLLKQQTGVELSVQAVFESPRLSDLASVLAQHMAAATNGADQDVDIDRVLESIALIEEMSEADLEALESQN